MKMQMKPELQVQLELDAHEKECALRYKMVDDKLVALDKRMWRIEAMIMASTITVVALMISIIMKYKIEFIMKVEGISIRLIYLSMNLKVHIGST